MKQILRTDNIWVAASALSMGATLEGISVARNGFATFRLSSPKSVILDYPQLYLDNKLRVDPFRLSSTMRTLKQDIDKAQHHANEFKGEGEDAGDKDSEEPGSFWLAGGEGEG